jgi:putative transposase
MPFKKNKPEEIIGNLREIEIVLAQGASTADACRQIAVSKQTYYRLRKEYGGLKTDQARRMKDLEKENLRLRRGISDLTSDKLILQEAARGNFSAPRRDDAVSIMCDKSLRCPSDGSAGCWASIDRRSARSRAGRMTSRRCRKTLSRRRSNMVAMAIAG